jgi:pyrroloquinoline quinone (PQQ) biosynthesis protein C
MHRLEELRPMTPESPQSEAAPTDAGPSIANVDDSWSDLLHAGWLASIEATSFMTRCRGGSIGRSELATFVLQHHHYARHFTRYLSGLLAAVVDEEDRQLLVRNLFEEMGLADGAGVPHARIYREMMASMGLDPRSHRPFPETERLVRTMLACCRSESPMVGLGALCLGAEAIVPRLYSTVVAGFESIGVAGEQLRFFHMHIAEDDNHARTMRVIIDRELRRHPEARIDLDYGAARAIAARVDFLRAITDRQPSSELPAIEEAS